jgi:putative NADH-flavin reductase
MRLTIFGATGRTGRVVVEQALRHGHAITAFTRDPAQLPRRPQLRAVAGDVLNPAAIGEAIEGAQAIISTLGRRRRGLDVCTEGIRTILSTMAGSAPRRLIILSNYGVAESRHRSAYVAVSWLLERAVLSDKEHMEALVRNSEAEWTLVRAPVLTNGPQTGGYRTGTDLRLGFTSRVSRADLAQFMLAQLDNDTNLRRAVAITSADPR